MKVISSLLLLFLVHSVHAQAPQKIRLSGVVVSRVPVPTADVFLKNNEQLGTLTNTSGYFHFTVPSALLYDTLVILAMGFEREEVPLAAINPREDTAYFYLEQQSILLKEVLVESEGLNLKELVLKAIASIRNNYPKRRHQLEGLYRKISTRGSEYTHLEEAAVTLEDKGYGSYTDFLTIKTEYFRQTNDWAEVDTMYVRAFDKMNRAISQRLGTAANPLNRVYNNPIRQHKQPATYLNFKSMRKYIDDYYTFELMDVSVIGGDTIYQIAFAESVTPPPPKRVSGRTYLRINATDLAIIETKFTRGAKGNDFFTQHHMTFEKKHDKYFPTYIRSVNHRAVNRNFDDEEYDIHTFWFDDVAVRGLRKLRDPDNQNDPVSHKRRPVNPAFWDTTSLIKKYPLEEAVRRNLEKRRALKEQFKNNGHQR